MGGMNQFEAGLVAGSGGPVPSERLVDGRARAVQGVAPPRDADAGRVPGHRPGDVPYRAVTEGQQVLGGLQGTAVLVDDDGGELEVPGHRVADADRRNAAEDVRVQRDGDGTGEHHTIDIVVNEPIDGRPELLTRAVGR